MKNSRLSGFYRKPVEERVKVLTDAGLVEEGRAQLLSRGGLTVEEADRLTENVIGLYALPLSVAPNFVINGEDRLVAMSIEEPSVVAAAANAARLVRQCGGFRAEIESHLMAAQVEVRGVGDVEQAAGNVADSRSGILELCRAHSCEIESFGGGVRDLEIRIVDMGGKEKRLVVHILVDCADAMGANTLNTIAEKAAPLIAGIAGGEPGLRILTNLADRRIVRARCRLSPEVLATYKGAQGARASGEQVRDAVIDAYLLADHDPYRAATHNKGMMNGIDAVLVATGNDWRAVEAGAHAFAAATGRYRSLSRWTRGTDGALEGEVRVPMAVGIVGGMTKFHPCAALSLRIMEVSDAKDLEMIVACVGLASNLGAMLALATEGIQRGHMRLHARH
jgi:hydroxymethylglutaryl-CoA reductase